MTAIRPGALAYWRGEACIVLELKGLIEAVIRQVQDKSTHTVRATELTTTPTSNVGLTAHHIFAEDHAWDVAAERYQLIRPLLEKGRNSREDINAVAEASGKTPSTIYRWIRRFQETRLTSSLLRTARSDAGNLRLDEEIESVITKLIEERYLVPERPTVAKLYSHIETTCKELGLQAPHVNTIYQRVRAIDEKERRRKRHGPRAAKETYSPLRGKFPEPGFPNAVVQIDHTPVDIILVDQQSRQPIGKPYLTMSIDVDSRMIGGFCLTLDPPSTTSAALCIAHAVLKKDYWIAKRELAAEWPIYGLMQKIHVDNAAEFRGKAMDRGCDEYGIILENRPKGQPNYGPHIERVFRTFMSETHTLPGTTFSNVKEKANYNSEGKACFTLEEFEYWFTVFVTYIYHNKPHEGICDTPPINRFLERVHGTLDQPGTGFPEVIENEEKFRLDFLPFSKKTVQRSGIVWDHIHYYAPILKSRIAEKDSNGNGRRFIVVRDPRDISIIYFLDPDDQTYYPVPYFNANHPPISLWEKNAATRKVKESPSAVVNETKIFEGVRLMREAEEKAVEKTRLAKNSRAAEKRHRRTAERRESWKGVHSPSTVEEPALIDDWPGENVEPFEIEMGGHNG